jgi:(p)ppGpp synthase/HD superfamily hydrolase
MITVHKIIETRPDLTSEFEPGHFEARTENIARAYAWGQQVHAGQKRMSGEPYFETHCTWVAALIDKLVNNEAWTIAALLHDAIEDQDESLDQVRQLFPGTLGEEIAYLVDGVTKISQPRDGRSREIETLRKIARFQDPGVFVIKLADKSHNLLTLAHMPPDKQIAKATEAIRAYGKLAGILNCYRWRRWIEDMAFPYAEPETYAFVKAKIDCDPRLQPGFVNPMMERLGKLMEEAGLDGEIRIMVDGYWQAWTKLRRMARARKSSMNSFAALNDVISFRMVIHSADENDCYTMISRVNRFFGKYLDSNRFDDFIANPQNGYRALQITAWLPELGALEVAIATEDMEGENVWGVVHALRTGRDISSYRPVEILTPTGGARFVPEGSTVLDAVASIQQELLLDKISAVEVNGGLAKLSDQVRPGDVVEVITAGERITPHESWLDFVNLSTERILRSVLAREALKRDAQQGRVQMTAALSARGILNLEDVQALDPDRVDHLLEELACAGLDDLHAAVGNGAIRLKDVETKLDETGISREALNWTTIKIIISPEGNKPGVLAEMAAMIAFAGGDILRSVNNPLPNGGFSMRFVVRKLTEEKCLRLQENYAECKVDIKSFEIV